MAESPVDEDGAPDHELMERLARGDMEALGDLYTRYAGVVRSVTYRYMRGHPSQSVQDVCHDAFLSLAEIAGRYAERGKLRGYLCGIAIKKAHNAVRRDRFRRILLGRWTEPDTGAPRHRPGEERHDIERALAKLPADQRDVLLLHTIDDLSGEEIAVALGLELNTVWTRLYRARAKLKALLSAEAAGKKP
jgi:RNA polymerase sigma factor (sigma-70 family)